ncbi:MAG: hypothetical protein G01um101425_998 [Candidatus Peregrinibacteria bacterium Gr01-1014_25]|nr:MAG: hypothetical protein G01um101425_998 [Candidatus Peregrinibacteria bacterium Gr01-1014_25]
MLRSAAACLLVVLLFASAESAVAASSSPRTSARPADTVARLSRRQLLRAYRQQQERGTAAKKPVATPAKPTPASRVTSPTYDTLPDTAVRSQLLLLGQTTPLLAGVRVFSNTEPVQATEIVVTLVSEAASVSQMLVYDQTGRFLATASQDADDSTNRTYSTTLPSGTLELPYRREISLSVRARLKPHTSGGASGDDIQVSAIRVNGNGSWSNADYSQASSETFNVFEATRARFARIENAGDATAILTGGTDQLLASFRFTGEETDTAAQLRVTDLTFTLDSYGGVTVSNPVLRVASANDTFACTAGASTITCSGITSGFGTVDAGALTLRVYGNVALGSGTSEQFLRLTLNNPGTPSSAGAITWTDGTSSFSWVGGDQPIMRGTAMSR